MIFAIDFDGTIVEHTYPKIGDLKPKAKRTINSLYDKGHYIIIWTCRMEPELTEMVNYLKMMKIKYHKVNENAPLKMLGYKPEPKIFANVYIDDLNMGGFPGWDHVRKLYLEDHKNPDKEYYCSFCEELYFSKLPECRMCGEYYCPECESPDQGICCVCHVIETLEDK